MNAFANLKAKAFYDLEAEKAVVCAALFRPTMLDDKRKLTASQFFDPFLGFIYEHARHQYALGQDPIKTMSSLYAADSWFFIDDEASGLDILWQCFDQYFDQADSELEDALWRILECAECRK